MGLFLRLLLLAVFVWIGYVLLSEAEAQSHLAFPDKGKVVMLFGGTIIDGLGIATILAVMIVPAIGESIGAFFFNPNTRIEHDPHADAIARLAQGDPEGAIEDYEEILAKDPTDTLALSEIARICCRDLGDTARAATVIERALDAEWPEEQSSFLANRLADIYMLQGDPMRARVVVVQIALNMEGTRYAANAQHRLHEIERAIEAGSHARPTLEEGSESADPESPQAEEAPASPEEEG